VKAFFKIAFACVLMAGAVLALPISETMPDIFELLIKAFIGAAVYGLVCFATDAANCRELIKTLAYKFTGKSQIIINEVPS
jgi:hypothetical protein